MKKIFLFLVLFVFIFVLPPPLVLANNIQVSNLNELINAISNAPAGIKTTIALQSGNYDFNAPAINIDNNKKIELINSDDAVVSFNYTAQSTYFFNVYSGSELSILGKSKYSLIFNGNNFELKDKYAAINFINNMGKLICTNVSFKDIVTIDSLFATAIVTDGNNSYLEINESVFENNRSINNGNGSETSGFGGTCIYAKNEAKVIINNSIFNNNKAGYFWRNISVCEPNYGATKKSLIDRWITIMDEKNTPLLYAIHGDKYYAIFSGSSASAILATNGSQIEVNSSTFSNNIGHTTVYLGSLTSAGIYKKGPFGKSDYFGDLDNHKIVKAKFNNTNFDSNSAASSSGGIFVAGNAELEVNGGVYTNNYGLNGGAIASYDGFSRGGSGENRRKYCGNEEMYKTWKTYYPAKVVINSGKFIDNTARSVGGGVYCASSEFYINSGMFKDNKSIKHGGAIYSSSPPNIIHLAPCHIEGNSATELGGGIWSCDTGIFEAKENGLTLINNGAGKEGDDFYSEKKIGSEEATDPEHKNYLTLNETLLPTWYAFTTLNQELYSPIMHNFMVNTVQNRLDGAKVKESSSLIKSRDFLSLKTTPDFSLASLPKRMVYIVNNQSAKGGGIGLNGGIYIEGATPPTPSPLPSQSPIPINTPKTGDNTPIIYMFLALSISIILVLYILNRKKYINSK